MSEWKEYDLSDCLQNGEIHLENRKIENCRISALQCKMSHIKNCVFENVIFDCQIEQDCIIIEECKFTNSEFHGNLGKTHLGLKNNLFKECLFEDISLEYMEGRRTVVEDNGFFECNFRKVKSEQEVIFINQTIRGGKMVDFFLQLDILQALNNQQCSNMQYNLFSNVQMENVHFVTAYNSNVMDSIVFRNATIERILELDNANSQDNNKFYKCDIAGLKCCMQQF